jgi:hypothetical protein
MTEIEKAAFVDGSAHWVSVFSLQQAKNAKSVWDAILNSGLK